MGLLLAGSLNAQTIPPLPDSSGWGVHVLAFAYAPDRSLWVGTYGQGIFVLRKGARSWEQIRASADTAAHSISWDFVHAFGFGPRGQIWYGTVGNGWGLSTDGGKTWRNWGYSELGPEWQYVTQDGILTRDNVTYIATADGIKVTSNDGRSWQVITDSIGATTATDPILGRLPNQYVHNLDFIVGDLMQASLSGWMATSDDGGHTWTLYKHGPNVVRDDGEVPSPRYATAFQRARSQGIALGLCSDPNFVLLVHVIDNETRGTPWGILHGNPRDRCLALPDAPPAGTLTVSARGEPARHTWFRRPIDTLYQARIDQTYRFGSTMGGNFQPHQGVEFNNGDGTPVYAIGDGVVVHSGPAERGALTVAIKHDRRLIADGGELFLFSAYYHNSRLLRKVGERVKAGDVIALVGNTGRATNDHLHLELHASPFDSTGLIVDSTQRYPPYNVNPELWIEPLRGTGTVAGQVWDSAGQPVYHARIFGLIKRQTETPFSFIETYGPRNHQDPAYREHFAITDVGPGNFVLGVTINGKKVFRRVIVEAGKVTWVEFRP
ncbi:MAG TPA: M23 family metallopeptidase [Gemmatimonadales bacterium]|nr:M23 family metallopeptidase [Gemmatimonadales bacterium]